MLTKGPVAIALPALAFALYLARARRELRRIREMMIPLGIVIVAAIVVPWYAALYRAARMDLHHVVLHQREHRAIYRRASAFGSSAA